MTETRQGGERLAVGVIAGPHGVRGGVRVKSYTALPKAIADYGKLTDGSGATVYALTVTGESRGMLIATIDGVADRDAAEALKGVELFIDRAALPDLKTGDEFYFADLVGLRAEAPVGVSYGTVKAVHDFGAGAVLEIDLAAGGTEFFPFSMEAVPEVDLEAGRLVVDPSVLADPDEGAA